MSFVFERWVAGTDGVWRWEVDGVAGKAYRDGCTINREHIADV